MAVGNLDYLAAPHQVHGEAHRALWWEIRGRVLPSPFTGTFRAVAAACGDI